jgi:hypothetical protein
MANRPIPSPQTLRQILRYEPETGKLYWLERPRSLFRTDHSHRGWNTRWAGKEAFTASNPKGYRQADVLGFHTCAHRVAWAVHFGEWPTDTIDHINGVTNDNRIANLRVCSASENATEAARRRARNGVTVRRRQSTGTTCTFGVHLDRSKKKCWRVAFRVNGKLARFGSYETQAEAELVSAKVRREVLGEH